MNFRYKSDKDPLTPAELDEAFQLFDQAGGTESDAFHELVGYNDRYSQFLSDPRYIDRQLDRDERDAASNHAKSLRLPFWQYLLNDKEGAYKPTPEQVDRAHKFREVHQRGLGDRYLHLVLDQGLNESDAHRQLFPDARAEAARSLPEAIYAHPRALEYYLGGSNRGIDRKMAGKVIDESAKGLREGVEPQHLAEAGLRGDRNLLENFVAQHPRFPEAADLMLRDPRLDESRFKVLAEQDRYRERVDGAPRLINRDHLLHIINIPELRGRRADRNPQGTLTDIPWPSEHLDRSGSSSMSTTITPTLAAIMHGMSKGLLKRDDLDPLFADDQKRRMLLQMPPNHLQPHHLELAAQYLGQDPLADSYLGSHPKASPAVIDKFLDATAGMQWKHAASNPNLIPQQIERIIDGGDYLTHAVIAARPDLSDAHVHKLAGDSFWDSHDALLGRDHLPADLVNKWVGEIPTRQYGVPPDKLRALIKRPELTPESLDKLAAHVDRIAAERRTGQGDPNQLRAEIAAHANVTEDTRARLFQQLPRTSDVRREAMMNAALENPDRFQGELSEWGEPGQVEVRPGAGRYRRGRDHILASGGTELHPKKMPPGDWSVGRAPSGNISAEHLQRHIDNLPALKFNYTHATYGSHLDSDAEATHRLEEPLRERGEEGEDRYDVLDHDPDWEPKIDVDDFYHEPGEVYHHDVDTSHIDRDDYTDEDGNFDEDAYDEAVQQYRDDAIQEYQDEREKEAWNDAEEQADKRREEEWSEFKEKVKDHHLSEQRHSNHLSKVFQVNLTTAHVRALKDAGVYDTFKALHDVSKRSGHPTGPAGIGWVRWTGKPGTYSPGYTGPRNNAKNDGIFIDEIQSDFGQDLGKRAAQEAREDGRMAPEEAERQINAKFPPDHMKKISEILFGGHKPNDIIAEAFFQYHRDKGRADVPVHMHTVDTKAPLSWLDPKCKSCNGRGRAAQPMDSYDSPEGTPCPTCKGSGKRAYPGHFMATYDQLPKKLALEPGGKYGELATETNRELKGKEVWQGKVRKSEKLGKSERRRNRREVAAVALYDTRGRLLFGLRRDSKRWTNPAGHLNPGENPRAAAARELKEEAAVDLPESRFEHLGTGRTKRGYIVHCYRATMNRSDYKHGDNPPHPHPDNDPDQEVHFWRWVDVSKGVPRQVADNLHAEENILLRLLGYQKGKVQKLRKMALKDISVGKPAGTTRAGHTIHDYSHVLDDAQRSAGYQIRVNDSGRLDFDAEAWHNGRKVGNVNGFGNRDHLVVAESWLNSGHQRKGIGSAMYEALMAHAHNHHGYEWVCGSHHSEQAHAVHQRLAEKHGLNYRADLIDDPDSDNDGQHEPYDYHMKAESLLKSASDEVAQLLRHPDPAHRSLALKLRGVRREHLLRALDSTDPALQRAAIDHPGGGDPLLRHLFTKVGADDLQLEALHRPNIGPDHLRLLWETTRDAPGPRADAILHGIASHNQLGSDTWRQLYDAGHHRRVLVNKPEAPQDALAGIARAEMASPSPDPFLAIQALKHPYQASAVLDQAAKHPRPEIRQAAAENPDLPEYLVDHYLATGRLPRDPDPDVAARVAVLKGWNVNRRHLDTALEDVHPDVRMAVFESPSAHLDRGHLLRAIARNEPDLINRALGSRAARS